MHTPPVGSVKVTNPFFKPVDQQSVTQPTDVDWYQSVNLPPASDLSGTYLPTQQWQVTSNLTSKPARIQNELDIDTDSDSEVSDWPKLSIFVEEVSCLTMTRTLLL